MVVGGQHITEERGAAVLKLEAVPWIWIWVFEGHDGGGRHCESADGPGGDRKFVVALCRLPVGSGGGSFYDCAGVVGVSGGEGKKQDRASDSRIVHALWVRLARGGRGLSGMRTERGLNRL